MPAHLVRVSASIGCVLAFLVTQSHAQVATDAQTGVASTIVSVPSPGLDNADRSAAVGAVRGESAATASPSGILERFHARSAALRTPRTLRIEGKGGLLVANGPLRGRGSRADSDGALPSMLRHFLELNLRTIAPGVPFKELRMKELPYECVAVPAPGIKEGRTFVLERVIAGVPVIGGSLIVRMQGDGTVDYVFNSLAPSTARIFDWRSIGRELRDVPAFDDRNLSRPERRAAGRLRQDKGRRVLIPFRGQQSSGLVEAVQVLLPPDDKGPMQIGFELSDGRIAGRSDIPATNPEPQYPPIHLDQRTGLPMFLTYADQGGLLVGDLGVFDNPAEIAYRYLEENPEIFRTGAARCQFDVVGIAAVPGSDTVMVRMEQVIAGRRVFGAQLVFEISGRSRIRTIQGHILPDADMPLAVERTGPPDCARRLR